MVRGLGAGLLVGLASLIPGIGKKGEFYAEVDAAGVESC